MAKIVIVDDEQMVDDDDITNFGLELVSVAHLYQVHPIIGSLELLLIKRLKIENAAKLLVFADQRNLSSLKSACISFIIKKTNFQLVRSTEDYNNLSSECKDEILDKIYGVSDVSRSAGS